MGEDKYEFVTYCGLYCGLCSARARTPRQAETLRHTMAKDGYEFWAQDMPGFKEFWAFLTDLSDLSKACPGCRQGGGPPFCGIRKCAEKRGLKVCVDCDEYPCHRIEAVGKGYPTLIADGRRMKAVGLDAWLAEQRERAATGFVYADIRCHPYEIPHE